MSRFFRLCAFAAACLMSLQACETRIEKKQEQLTASEFSDPEDSAKFGLRDKTSLSQINSSVNSVVMTGLDSIRLVTVYKLRAGKDRNINLVENTTYSSAAYDENGNPIPFAEDEFHYFMPGVDVIGGYNLVNIGHYNMADGKLSYFFDRPVLVRNLYFPGVKADAVNGKRVTRDYFMVSAYDADTNRDSLINKKDLRRMYHFDKLNTKRTALLPEAYSAIRSTYDYKNGVMYIYARFDANRNGTSEKNEPVSIFWIDLKSPVAAKKII